MRAAARSWARRMPVRLVALYVLVFAVSAVILGAAVFLTAREVLEHQMEGRIRAEMTLLKEEFTHGGMARLAEVVRLRGRGASALDYLLQDGAGLHLAGEMPGVGAPARGGWKVVDIPQASEDDGRPEQVLALISDLGGGALLAVGDDLRRIREVEEAILIALAWAVGLAALLAIAGGVVVSRLFLAKVDAISRTAEAIIAGDLSRRIPLRGSADDLDHLAETLNFMLDRIERLMDSLRQVSSDVAHDLRTPLARLLQKLERAGDPRVSASEYQQLVEAATREAEGLLDTFAALLRVANLEGAASHDSFQAIALEPILESVADAYRPDAEADGRSIMLDIVAGAMVMGDRELLTQAIANLVENAMRHTPPGTRIALELRSGQPDAGLACVTVRDDGPGVPAADLDRLTHRFFRTERSRSRPGNGLGLTLVAAVAEFHHGTLTLENASPGLIATLRLPLWRAGPG